jgi:hypothetical protein
MAIDLFNSSLSDLCRAVGVAVSTDILTLSDSIPTAGGDFELRTCTRVELAAALEADRTIRPAVLRELIFYVAKATKSLIGWSYSGPMAAGGTEQDGELVPKVAFEDGRWIASAKVARDNERIQWLLVRSK